MKKKDRALAHVVRTAVRNTLMEDGVGRHDPTFHLLTVHFASGESVSIPYQPWNPRAEVSLPYRIDREDTIA